MAKDNAVLKYLDGKKMYLGIALYFIAQGLKALNPVVLRPLTNFEVPDSLLKVVEDMAIALGGWGSIDKFRKEHK